MNPQRTRTKICGIREEAHALVAARAGADAVGFVFHAPSPRAIEAERAASIARALPPFVEAVGLFVNMPADAVRSVLKRVPLTTLQFHGDEDPGYCEQFGMPWLRAVRVGPATDLLEYARAFSGAKALLLDAHAPGEFGGSGATFDWALVPREMPLPVILSGGLTAANVGEAIRAVRPWAVDVSSGVESSRGFKDAALIEEFLRSVRDADRRIGG
jgi:phosphoribosylanthranilate isomerase